jgi:hypothetical protein
MKEKNTEFEEAKSRVANEGSHCRACGQMVKLYRRAFNHTLAVALAALYSADRERPEEWVHLANRLAYLGHPDIARGGDAMKLKFWILAEKQPGERPDGSNRLGYWRITPWGTSFVQGIRKISKYVYVYNNSPYGFSKQSIGLSEAFHKGFNLQEILGG